jgi:hypothetical protein
LLGLDDFGLVRVIVGKGVCGLDELVKVLEVLDVFEQDVGLLLL